MTIFLLHWWPTEIQNLSKEKYFDANLQSKNLGRPALSASAVLYRPVVLQLANKACHVKVQTQGQILVTLHVRPAPQKHAHDAAELFTHVLAGFPPQTVILTDYRLKSDQGQASPRVRLQCQSLATRAWDGEAARLGTVVFASTYKGKEGSEGSLRIFLVSVFI